MAVAITAGFARLESTDSPVPKKPIEEWSRVSEAQKEMETLNYARITTGGAKPPWPVFTS